ncbi:PTS sugar transporter subunit IIA [Clostridium sporogenes]|uniref:PTS sugar transporter subunit IIA n=1 Tax=Clostridium sporogenes TaxID=1509 RepID=UPI0013D8ADFC|nr:PTS sugar transporter subunit IIA [Clostridium sporogenes]NFD93544.1 PTS sugar transporter subunit IIA [Clostridium sporogenes]NFE44577.1 PTS sugar transporter subunit IIA [Clostridium sporogenes]NFF15565.1 PTS sugar transporter subunit IIA [Clostridium sporogenes]NFF72666.1 PTS sugar transporter subunit IIA [Clostridium sporogenes]NFF94508.1 PTS sugar transporter subunit IIA [Clostridium sporogenes]
MLKNYINDQVVEVNVEVKNWEEAVRLGGKLLEEDGAVEHSYIDAMVDTVKNMGPYIVIAPGIAMPHARPEAGAKNIRIGLLKLKNPVNFGNEEHDPVDIVIFLCAVDNKAHIEVLGELVQLIEDEDFLKIVRNASTKKEILDYIK